MVGIKHVRFFLGQFVSITGKNYYSFVKLFGFSHFFGLDLNPYMKFSIYIGTYKSHSFTQLLLELMYMRKSLPLERSICWWKATIEFSTLATFKLN